MDIREQLQELLSEYVEDTLVYISTVSVFCDEKHKWMLQRETELEKMREIKHQADQVRVDSRNEKLEKELGAVLKDTLEGLEKLEPFLDAVEKLTVTSLFVFTGQSFLPMGESPESVRSVITAARMASPLLIHFKRNAKTFFLPSLSNLDVLISWLDRYKHITNQICERMRKKCKSVWWSEDLQRCKKGERVVKFSLNLSEDSMQKMLDHLKQLCEIRMDPHTRMAFLFQKHAVHFIGQFSRCGSRMERFLSDLEENAVQLDRMKKGASISTVAGSSVGLAGGILSIVGLALAPVTAGVSLALTLAGVSLGVTSGVNSVVTGIAEAAVNRHHGKNAQSIFQRFMDDVGATLACLEQASSEERLERLDGVDPFGAGKLMARTGGVVKRIESLVDAVSAVKLPKTDLSDIGQLAKGTPLALSKSARAGFITLNVFFIGVDVFLICKESRSLAKGSRSEKSQLIRSRAALWKSELQAWKNIHDSLCIGIQRFRKSQEMLEQRFLP